MMQPSHTAGVSDMMAAVTAANNKHFALTRNAAMGMITSPHPREIVCVCVLPGQGFDRHLFALRVLAEESEREPDIFTDSAYRHMNHIIVSTSTLSTDSVLIGGFAPVTPDGYGVGYNVSSLQCLTVSLSLL